MLPPPEDPSLEGIATELYQEQSLNSGEETQRVAESPQGQTSGKKPNPLAAAFTPRGATFSETLEDIYGLSIEYTSASGSGRFVKRTHTYSKLHRFLDRITLLTSIPPNPFHAPTHPHPTLSP